MAKEAVKPSDLELQVLSVLWQQGPRTARQVLESLPDRKPRAYTTVLTVLQVMEKKGLVKHTEQGTAYVYSPAVTRKQIMRPLVRGWVAKFFGGSATAAVQQLLQESDLDQQTANKVRKLLDEAERDQSS